MKVKLERVENGMALRTSEIVGYSEIPVAIGRPFIMTAPPIDPTRDIRVVSTSPVVEIIEGTDCNLVFKTYNSTYRLTRLGILDEENN